MNIEKALINIMKTSPTGPGQPYRGEFIGAPKSGEPSMDDIIASRSPSYAKRARREAKKLQKPDRAKWDPRRLFGLSKEKNVEKIIPLVAGAALAPIMGAAKVGIDAIGTLGEIGSAGADANRAATEGITNSTKSTKKSVEKGLKSHSIHPTHQDPSNPSNHYNHSKRKREAPHQSMAKAFQLEKAPRSSAVYGNASTIGGNTQARGGLTFQTPDRWGGRHQSQNGTARGSSNTVTPNVSDTIEGQKTPDNKAEHVGEFNAYNYTDTLSRNLDDLFGYYGGGKDAKTAAEAREKADAESRALQDQAAQAQIAYYNRNGTGTPEGNWWDNMSREELEDWLNQYDDPLSQYEDYQPEQKNIE